MRRRTWSGEDRDSKLVKLTVTSSGKKNHQQNLDGTKPLIGYAAADPGGKPPGIALHQNRDFRRPDATAEAKGQPGDQDSMIWSWAIKLTMATWIPPGPEGQQR